MVMKVLYGAGPDDIKGFDTARLRKEFLVEDLFQPGEVSLLPDNDNNALLDPKVNCRSPY